MILVAAAALGAAVGQTGAGSLLSAYTDPNYQIVLGFGPHSHWIQPWRGYLETVPATRFLNGIGVVFNGPSNPNLILEHLAKHGVKLTRIEVGWGNLSYADDSLDSPYITATLQACKKWGIRPIILLNANEGDPCPVLVFSRTVTADAPAGSTTVQLNDTSGLVLGRSGLSDLTDNWAAEALIIGINGNTVTLSKPLPNAIAANTSVNMATLKYRPFSPPGTADYAQTIAAWQRYVLTVATYAANALGTASSSDKGFDMEIWNELTFGSNFLYINTYYNPALYNYSQADIWTNLVQATASFVQNNPNAFNGVQLGDGFANTIPWPASSKEPVRINAICKHPYPRLLNYPADDIGGTSVNAELQYETQAWVPTYHCSFPEYYGTGLQAEHVIRDMSPITTDIYGENHGRYARVVNGTVIPCDEWITEIGYNPGEAGITDPVAALNLKAKTTARFLCFFLQKGAPKLTLFATQDSDLGFGIVQDNFNAYAASNQSYPADDSSYTSPALRVTQQIVSKVRERLDPGLTATRTLQVTGIEDTHGHYQFAGDGTAAHPPLYDREVLAILPIQVNANRFVIPYYVMTRDVTQPLVPEQFTIQLTGIKAANAKVSAYDPINNQSIPVAATASSSGNAVTLTVTAADYPYLLIIDDGIAGT